MCSGWIKTLTKPEKMSELAMSRNKNKGGLIVDNCLFVKCGTALSIKGGYMQISSSHIENCGISIAASNGAFIDASSISINECEIVFKEDHDHCS